MLTDEEVLPTCFYWAKRLCTKTVPFNELVNEAYLVAKKLRSPLLLQKWVKWTMIHFIQHGRSLSTLPEGIDVKDTSFDFAAFREMQEELMRVVDKVCNEIEKRFLYLSFWQGLSYRAIAKIENISFQGVFYRINTAIEKIRREYGRI